MKPDTVIPILLILAMIGISALIMGLSIANSSKQEFRDLCEARGGYVFNYDRGMLCMVNGQVVDTY